jgi:hypothetical protein
LHDFAVSPKKRKRHLLTSPPPSRLP